MLNQVVINIQKKNKYSYLALLDTDSINNWPVWLPQYCSHKQIVIITDKIVERLYANKLYLELVQHGYRALILSIEPGESSKTHQIKQDLELKMLQAQYDHQTLIIAFGGGVIGDLAGFIAATYMRGIPYVQIPTTLLAMVDSSVGGKTAIDTPYGKNLIGAMWQPKLVLVNLSYLSSLSKIHLICGMIEAIKMFLTLDAKSFNCTYKNLNKLLKCDTRHLHLLVQRSLQLKSKVVASDTEHETNRRMILNFGHTIGHALEQVSQFQILHAYAVALGILVEAKIAQLLGYFSNDNYQLICNIFAHLGINADMLRPFPVNDVIAATALDKKTKNGKIYCVLLKNIGEIQTQDGYVVHEISHTIIEQAFKQLQV